MYVVRLSLEAKAGEASATLKLLQDWIRDVGERAGVRASSTRLITGSLGPSQGVIELEFRVDALNELDSTWSYLESNPHHGVYLAQISTHLVSAPRWSTYLLVE